jgi:putative tryptophan/tyrosine transport system substrate-binding protein
MPCRIMGLLVTLVWGPLVTPLAGQAMPAAKVARIGWLWPFLAPSPDRPSGVSRVLFPQVMAELGWVEGQNLRIDHRYAELRYDRLPALAAALVQLQADVLIGHTILAARALKQAPTTIPIVMLFVGDAVQEGLVASLARPGGHVTGVSSRYAEVISKRREFLRDAVPQLARLAVLFNPAFPTAASVYTAVGTAQAVGATVQLLEVRDPSAFEEAFTAMTRARADALLILNDPLTVTYRKQLAQLAVSRQLPTVCEERTQALEGCLMSYGQDQRDVVRRAAYYVDRLLKGAKPADLPVEQPTTFELVINLKTAQALGLTIPPALLFQATEVIR